MSVIALPGPSVLVVPSSMATGQLFRFSVALYHSMIETGLLTPADRVELLEGCLVEKMSIHPPHRIASRKVRKALERVAPTGWYEAAAQPITLEDSEPEPDAVLARGATEHYPDRHPGPQDVALVVEVSDSSLAQDRGWKKRIYARALIRCYWIVNLVEGQVEVYTDPTGPANQPDYRQRRDFGPADEVPLMIDGQEVARIPVSDLLP